MNLARLTDEQEQLIAQIQASQRTAEQFAALLATFVVKLLRELAEHPLDPDQAYLAARMQGSIQTLTTLHDLITERQPPSAR